MSVTLKKFDPVTLFTIWQPRWHDKKVLLSAPKVDNSKTQHLKVIFTKAPSMEGDWYVNKARVKKFPKESNGTIQTYVVPLSELQPLEVNERDIREFI